VFISDHARNAICAQAQIPLDRTTRIYLGRDPTFTPEAEARSDAVLSRFGLARPYVLSVSHFYHYKNFVELVEGFAIARRRLPSGMRLAIAGAEHERAYAAEVRAAIARAGLASHVTLLGAVPGADLPPLYAAASAFVFPSTCESFPNILVEGMASGALTLVSNRQPMGI
jgi:glycosyltransferase involved in cell wall biosynthesis